MLVYIFILSIFCSLPYRELVFDEHQSFQTYGALPAKNHFRVPEKCAYWYESADVFMSLGLKNTIGNRTIEFDSEEGQTLTVLTRGLEPVIALDDEFLTDEEFFRVSVGAGRHTLTWITSRIVLPSKGNGFSEPVQTAAWLSKHPQLAISI